MHNDWPDNVREVKVVMEQSAVISDTDLIDEDDILF
jgi:DNA-binding NtrC family response regulator